MQNVVREADIQNMDKLKMYVEDLFKKGHYPEITQAIGMHALLRNPEHTMTDEAGLYHFVLNILKERIRNRKGCAQWYADFPKLMDELVSSHKIVLDKPSADVLASHRAGFGPFKSLDDFFFWALNDRRLSLDQIMKYIEKTTEMHGK